MNKRNEQALNENMNRIKKIIINDFVTDVMNHLFDEEETHHDPSYKKALEDMELYLRKKYDDYTNNRGN